MTPPQGQRAQGTSVPPARRYVCNVYSSRTNQVSGKFTFSADGTYAVDGSGSGRYRYDSGASKVIFTSGPYAEISWYGVYSTTDFNGRTAVPTIILTDPTLGPASACHLEQ